MCDVGPAAKGSKGWLFPHPTFNYNYAFIGLTTTCGCLFGFVYKRKPTPGEIYQRRELSARAAFFLWMVGV